ncbi:MAG: 3-hydroxyacyl-CoA dehydrogenase NAD-binding domain-containing protein [Gammaproteobacteria bacterium]
MRDNFNHWRCDTDQDHILWLMFDKANASANTLDQEVFAEFSEILNEVEQNKQIKAMVIASAKKSGFIAGANIERFTEMKDIEEVKAFIQTGQNLFLRLSKLAIPTVAMIDGFCLGGGFELALACRYRVACDQPKTKIGLPEVLLGIQPGWGGSVRLPALIGAPNALALILAGKISSARSAAKIGMVDAAVPKRYLDKAARYYALQKEPPHHASFLQALTNTNFLRPLIYNLSFNKLKQKINPKHYPAPFGVLANWKKYGTKRNAFQVEVDTLSKLIFDQTAQQLVRVFFLQDRLKGLAKSTSFKPKHVHVIGAGTMGGDIAACCAFNGLTVTLQDREANLLAPAFERASKLYKEKLKEPSLVQATLDRLMPDVHGEGVKKADMIIEAIYENLEAKQDLFKHLEKHAKAEAVLATNTSSIPLDEINAVMKNKGRLVGIHFFNPVSKMRLVEVVRGDKTDETVYQQACAFVRLLDRLPLPVKSSPGFLVNRILMAYLMEAMMMLESGISPSAIDKAAKDFGMPMGPVELADTVGLDICLSVASNLIQHYGGHIPEKLTQLVEQKKLGNKTGQGFYTFKNGKPVRIPLEKSSVDFTEITNRLMFRMLNESVACLREGVVADQDLLDAGMIFGTGFAPFRGGPMTYIKSLGKATALEKLTDLEGKFGERFKEDLGWGKI